MYSQRHCILCCGDNCHCTNIQDWGPSTWHGDQSVQRWGKYFVQKHVCKGVSPMAVDICRSHLREVRRLISNRQCLICTTTHCEKWFPTTLEFEWFCEACQTGSHGKARMQDMLKRDNESDNEMKQIRARIIEEALSEIQENTFVYTLPLINTLFLTIA